MGTLDRFSTIVKSKLHKLFNRWEDPRETLDYSYEKQMDLLRKVRRSLTDVVTAKKRLELQKIQLEDGARQWEEKARQALGQNREDLARQALERKAQMESQARGLVGQIQELQQEQEKLQQAEAQLTAKVESFRSQKEIIKAQYSAAEASVKIGEALTGLSKEMADVGQAIERAQDKTAQMKARSAAIDELVQEGVLEEPGQDPVMRELDQLEAKEKVEKDLQRLKDELGR
ncbi:MAG: PspA/IM30 family protein, partial [Bacillota bacterium]|nr:PspA/IM30 family protein [Bacillota bacterium]